jgi:arsenite methyltransferase
MVAIFSNQREVIFGAVRAMYTDVASSPDKEFHFPTGRRACELVGYPAALLDSIPLSAVESFAGVGYPFQVRAIRVGDHVLDIGSGSGTDVLVAAQLTGRAGRVIGLDMTPAMRAKLQRNADLVGAPNVAVMEGNAEEIPLPDASVDVVTSNGVLNLVPDKRKAFAEIARVLRPGGRLQLADIIVSTLPSAECRSQPELWAECIVGAIRDTDYVSMLGEAGLCDVEIVQRLDYFAGSSSDETRKVAGSFDAHTVVIRACK